MAYMREFSKPKYNVDVLKLEVPINMKFVEGTRSFKGEKAYTKAEAMELFRKSAEATNKPFIYLSAGVSNAEFSETLELVGESGVKYNGVLCGRATWADGVPIFAEKGLAGFPRMAGSRRREEHPKRERRTEGGFAVVSDLRGVSANELKRRGRRLAPLFYVVILSV